MEIGQSVTGTKKYEEQETGSESLIERMTRERDERTARMKAAYEAAYARLNDAMPVLRGSEKQMAWAEKIRTSAAQLIRRQWRPYAARTGRMVEAVTENDLARIEADTRALRNQDASWWISNRSRWGA